MSRIKIQLPALRVSISIAMHYPHLIVFALLVFGTAFADPPRESATTQPAAVQSHDHFVGWYRLPRRSESGKVMENAPATYVPVIKRDGNFYCIARWMEVPLKPIENGLEWNALPSTMEGTRFLHDPATGQYSISISGRNDQSDNGLVAVPRPAERVAAPLEIPNVTAAPPKGLDGFIGSYEMAWAPALRIRIEKDGDKFTATSTIIGEQARPVETSEAFPLPDELGFSLGERGKAQFVYNPSAGRYEIRSKSTGATVPLLRHGDSDPGEVRKWPAQVGSVGIPVSN